MDQFMSFVKGSIVKVQLILIADMLYRSQGVLSCGRVNIQSATAMVIFTSYNTDIALWCKFELLHSGCKTKTPVPEALEFYLPKIVYLVPPSNKPRTTNTIYSG